MVPGRHSGWWSAPVGRAASGRGGPDGPRLLARVVAERRRHVAAAGWGTARCRCQPAIAQGAATVVTLSAMTTDDRPPAQGRHPAPRGRARGALAGAARHDPRHRGPRLRLGLGRRAPPLSLGGPAAARSVGGLDAARRDRRRRPRGSSSARSSPARTSTTRRCSPSRPRRSTRSAAAASSSASAPAGTRPSSAPSATRSTTGSTASRRRSRSSGRCSARAPSTSTGAGTRPATASSCRAARDPAARR